MSTALVVMAKAPVAGRVKTRLIPALGAEGAARLAHQLLLRTVHKASGLQLDHLELCVSPDTGHPVFEQLCAQGDGRLALTAQGDGDLGARMHRALERVLHRYDKALLIGTDAPALTSQTIRLAEAALHDHDAVFVPAIDGGYVLVGLTRPAPNIFRGISWSTSQVMIDTRARAREAQLKWTELPPVHDIDEPADLVHLPQDWL